MAAVSEAAVIQSDRGRVVAAFRLVMALTRHHRRLFATAVAGAAVFAACTVLSAVVVSRITDDVIEPRFRDGQVPTGTVAVVREAHARWWPVAGRAGLIEILHQPNHEDVQRGYLRFSEQVAGLAAIYLDRPGAATRVRSLTPRKWLLRVARLMVQVQDEDVKLTL